MLDFGLASQAHTPELSEREGQPEPLHTTSPLHFAVMPAPQPPLKIFEATFNPRAESIPGNLGLFRLQIRHDDPRAFITRLPLHEHSRLQSTGFANETLHLAVPADARGRHPVAEPRKVLLADLTGFAAHIDP